MNLCESSNVELAAAQFLGGVFSERGRKLECIRSVTVVHYFTVLTEIHSHSPSYLRAEYDSLAVMIVVLYQCGV